MIQLLKKISTSKTIKHLMCLFGIFLLLSPDAHAKFTVLTTTTQVKDLVQNIAGDKAEVTGLLHHGIDPHLYKLTRTDTSKLLNADMVFYSGLALEGKMSTLLNRMHAAQKPVYAIADLIDPKLLIKNSEKEGFYDPHIWNDVKLWANAANGVALQLCDHDPQNCSFYKQNANNYRQQLHQLDFFVQDAVKTIPRESRILITAHDAFRYLGKAYNIDVVGIQGLSTDSEIGLYQINKLVDLIVDRKISSIFIESNVPDKNIKAIIEGARAKGHLVQIGGSLYADSMGPCDKSAGTYIGMIEHNITTITKALGGEPKDLKAEKYKNIAESLSKPKDI